MCRNEVIGKGISPLPPLVHAVSAAEKQEPKMAYTVVVGCQSSLGRRKGGGGEREVEEKGRGRRKGGGGEREGKKRGGGTEGEKGREKQRREGEREGRKRRGVGTGKEGKRKN